MKRQNSVQYGMALIAVLWMVAALSLITIGIVQSVRNEIRVVGTQRQMVQANASADAAILLALQAVAANQAEPGGEVQILPVPFNGVMYEVSIFSLNGLIDINSAPSTLLTALYRYAGGLSASDAGVLAQATVDTRENRNSKTGIARSFDAIEDLMSVPHMSYAIYAKVADLVCAEIVGGSGRVNPKIASVGVLEVLAEGDQVRALDLARKRNREPKLMDTSTFNPAFIEISSSRSLQFGVQVVLPDGGTLLKNWHVYWAPDPRTRLPWRILSTRSSLKYGTQANS